MAYNLLIMEIILMNNGKPLNKGSTKLSATSGVVLLAINDQIDSSSTSKFRAGVLNSFHIYFINRLGSKEFFLNNEESI
jgi:hypothetical protein